MDEYLIDILECPVCHHDLDWTIIEQSGNDIETAQALCEICNMSYPISEGIGIFLPPDLPREDLWEHVDSWLNQHLRENPELESRLMNASLDTLAPADKFFRSMLLEERGEYAQAREAEDTARVDLYTSEYLTCVESQVDYLIERLKLLEGPVIDLASGRMYLVEKIAKDLERPIVATDFSPWVLLRNRRWLEFFGLYRHVSLLALDARRTPFKDGVVSILTTYLGLPNILEPGSLMRELRRILAGKFLAITHFYPQDDEKNATALRRAGVDQFLFRTSALGAFAEAGLQVEVTNRCTGVARPTPVGVLMDGIGIDAFPVEETTLEWCVLDVR